MRLPPPPSDFANLVVTLSQMGDTNVICGSYDGITLFVDRMLPVDRLTSRNMPVQGQP